jgi:hypothetical protein
LNTAAFALTGGSPSGGTYSGTGVSSGTFNPGTSGAGTHTITYTYTDGNSCTNSDTSNITVNSLPTVTLSSLAAVCAGAPTFALTGGSPSGGTYTGTGVSSGNFDPSTAGAGTHTITYTYTDGNTCTNTANQTITVYAQPVVTLSAQPNICENAPSVVLSGGSPIGGIYKGTGVSSGIFNPAISGAGTFSITYVVTNANSCTDSASAMKTVDTATVLAYPTLPNICLNSGLVNIATATPVGGIYSGMGIVSDTMFNPLLTGLGTHLIRYTYTNLMGCVDSISQNVLVDTLPANVTITIADSICVNADTLLPLLQPAGGVLAGNGVVGNAFIPIIATSGTHILTYSFTGANGCAAAAYDTIRVDALTPLQLNFPDSVCINAPSFGVMGGIPTGGYYRAHSISAGIFDPSQGIGSTDTVWYGYTNAYGCSDSVFDIIRLDSVPIISYTPVPNICANDTLVLSCAVPVGGVYSGVSVSNGVLHPAGIGGSYTFTYTYTDARGCVDSITTNINVDSVPSVKMPSVYRICANAEDDILAIGTPLGGIYDGNGIFGDTLKPSILATDTSRIRYTYTDGNGCMDSAFSVLVRDTVPLVQLAVIPGICLNSSTTFLNFGTPTGGVYSSPVVRNDTVLDPSLVTQGGIYPVVYKYTDARGCTDTATGSIAIDTITLIESVLYDSICANADTVILSGGVPSGGVYSGIGVDRDSLFFAPAVGGNVTRVTYHLSNKCGTDTMSAMLGLRQIPTVTLDIMPDGCANDEDVVLSGGMPMGGVYRINEEVKTVISPEDYLGINKISYSYSDVHGCTNSVLREFIVNDIPQIEIGGKTSLCLGDTLQLLAISATGVRYYWDGDSAASEYTVYPGALKQGFTYHTAVVQDEKGCRNEASVLVNVRNCGNSFYIFPNPNSGQFNVYLHLRKDQEVQLGIVSTLGKVLLTEQQLGRAGLNKFLVHFLAEGAGTYFLFLEIEGERYIEKFVVD